MNENNFNTNPEQEATMTRAERRRMQEKLRRRRLFSRLRALPFAFTLLTVTVIAWLLPLRPTTSDSEKRLLATFPECSASSLVDGSFFKGVDTWFSDTFTFRESWVHLNQRLEKLHGVNTVAVYGEVPQHDAVPVKKDTAEAVTVTVTPPPVETLIPEVPLAEREGGENEELTIEPEAAEEKWKGVEINDEDFVAQNSTVLQIGDITYCYPGFNQYYAGVYANCLNQLAEKMEGKATVYSVLIPENVTYNLRREDREKYGFVIEEDAFDYIFSCFSDKVKAVNIIPNLVAHNDEYLSFRTDHHWTARGAYYAYDAWCQVAGKETVPLSDYTELTFEGFLGSYYYYAQQSKYLADNPDTVYAYVPPGDVHLYLNLAHGDGLGEEYDIILDRSQCAPGAKYLAFLYTDDAKETFVNNDIQDGSACAVIKNSFGNPFVYYLTQHYQYVYVLDSRYYRMRDMENFVEKFDVDDIIFAHSSEMCYYEGGLACISFFTQ